MTPPLLSPVTGAELVENGPDLLRDSDGQLWPVLDDIPYLRTGRDALVDEVVGHILVGDHTGALALLLADQDDWWTGAKPDPADLETLIRERDRLTLRAAMDLLGFDRVGTYFAHRWSDPTFLAGLGLLEAHWRPASSAFELACGIGHYGRELSRLGVHYTGVDVVFSKLWLAHHWVLPADARLLCFDAAESWPLKKARFDLVFCHDAFYFLEPKPAILDALRQMAGPDGRLALSHIHNSQADNLSAGRAISIDGMAQLFPDALFYDDAELTRALAEARAPQSARLADLDRVEAFAVEDRPRGPAHKLERGLAVPPAGAQLRLNPLYRPRQDGLAIDWPSDRYRAEYGSRATYPESLPDSTVQQLEQAGQEVEAARRRILVDLPERW